MCDLPFGVFRQFFLHFPWAQFWQKFEKTYVRSIWLVCQLHTKIAACLEIRLRWYTKSKLRTFRSSPSLWMRCALSVDASYKISQNDSPILGSNPKSSCVTEILIEKFCMPRPGTLIESTTAQNLSQQPHGSEAPTIAGKQVNKHVDLFEIRPSLDSLHITFQWKSKRTLLGFKLSSLLFCVEHPFVALPVVGLTGRLVWTSLNQSSGLQLHDTSIKWWNPFDFETLHRSWWAFRSTGRFSASLATFGQTRLANDVRQSKSAMTLSASCFDFSHRKLQNVFVPFVCFQIFFFFTVFFNHLDNHTTCQ